MKVSPSEVRVPLMPTLMILSFFLVLPEPLPRFGLALDRECFNNGILVHALANSSKSSLDDHEISGRVPYGLSGAPRGG